MWQKILYLGLAGAAGTIARYWLSGVIQRHITIAFPFGTVVVNILGCFLFGLLWAFMENRLSISGQTRTVVFPGFFGAFTTFSSFAFETSQLLDESQWLWASGNILLQNVPFSLIAAIPINRRIQLKIYYTLWGNKFPTSKVATYGSGAP